MVSLASRVLALGRIAFESSVGGPLRVSVSGREARAEQRFVRAQAETYGFSSLTLEALKACWAPKPAADTFFILGSGASVRDLCEADFLHVGEQRSVGINNWPLHPFVPDVFAFESVPWVGDGNDFARALSYLNREDIVAAGPPLLVLRPRSGNSLKELNDLPPGFRERVFFYGRITPVTRRKKNLESEIGFLTKNLGRNYPGVLLDSGASVVRLIHLALVMGYPKIVLVGVDLNNTEYFWENNRDYDLNLVPERPANNQQSAKHETMGTLIRPFSVPDMVIALKSAAETGFGAKLYIGSPKSELAQYLPLYPWKVAAIEGE